MAAERPDAPADEQRRLAAALRVLYSAPTWELLVDGGDVDADGAAQIVEEAARRLLRGDTRAPRRKP